LQEVLQEKIPGADPLWLNHRFRRVRFSRNELLQEKISTG
jgi:hypothetical protein